MMEKLKKLEKDYYTLYDSDGDIVASNNPKTPTTKKLSLKNCIAIENGYDLDELAKLSYKCDPYIAEYLEQEFKKGFQKALEILGDKKFSEIDMKSLFSKTLESSPSTETHTRMISNTEYRHFVMDEMYDRIIQSLQQTEWDCIITKEYLSNSGEWKEVLLPSEWETDTQVRYKTDADGCLILKRK